MKIKLVHFDVDGEILERFELKWLVGGIKFNAERIVCRSMPMVKFLWEGGRTTGQSSSNSRSGGGS